MRHTNAIASDGLDTHTHTHTLTHTHTHAHTHSAQVNLVASIGCMEHSSVLRAIQGQAGLPPANPTIHYTTHAHTHIAQVNLVHRLHGV